MPRVYRRRGYGRKRSSRRRSALSSRSIYGNKSARAQSYQIAALRNRMRRMSRQLRPETKVWLSGIKSESYTSSITGTWCSKYEVMGELIENAGAAEGQMIGDKITVKSLQILAHFDFHSVNDPQSQMLDSYGGCIRIVVFQSKARSNETAGSIGPSVIVTNAAGSGTGYDMIPVAPLTAGITERFTILADKSYSITESNNQRLIRFSVKPRNIRKNESDYYNKVFCFIYVSGLHWTSTTYYEEVRQQLQFKVAYTDA